MLLDGLLQFLLYFGYCLSYKMNYNWKKQGYYILKAKDDIYNYKINTSLMHPYGHLYLTVYEGNETILDLSYEEMSKVFKLNLTPGDYTSENSKSIAIEADDYFKCLITIAAHTSYILSKELYNDLLHIIKCIKYNNPIY